MRYKNNPANIRNSARNAWKGLSGYDNGFCEFYDIVYGLRALCVLLRRYIVCYGLKDVEGIISRFAPPSENNTSNYIRFVRDYLRSRGFDSSDITFGSKQFCCLVCAICVFESHSVYSIERIANIIEMFKLK